MKPGERGRERHLSTRQQHGQSRRQRSRRLGLDERPSKEEGGREVRRAQAGEV